MTGKERLDELEKEDKYVFHGSEEKFEELEPQQAYNGDVPDGEPAVFASRTPDYAIFMAIMNRKNCPNGFRAGTKWKEDGKIEFSATKETLDQLNEKSSGYVYVFNRSDFENKHFSGVEWVSYTKVKPIEVIEVLWSDFTPEIKLKD